MAVAWIPTFRTFLALHLLLPLAAFAQDCDDGYGWAEENDISDFDDCESEFGAAP
jgi:hypothetical protein